MPGICRIINGDPVRKTIMRKNHLLTIFTLLMAIVLSGYGCASAQPGSNNAKAAATETKPAPTKVTKDNLKARLAGKKVQFIETRSDNERPNPLFLMIKIVGSGADGKTPLMATLNGEKKEVGELITGLRTIFKYREDKGIFQEGKNEVDKRVNIAAGDADIEMYNKENIYVEDVERLIDELQKAGIDQIYVNFVSSVRELGPDDLGSPPAKK